MEHGLGGGEQLPRRSHFLVLLLILLSLTFRASGALHLIHRSKYLAPRRKCITVNTWIRGLVLRRHIEGGIEIIGSTRCELIVAIISLAHDFLMTGAFGCGWLNEHYQ
jgi:hypothetical protein